MIIRRARGDEGPALEELALRSKSHWPYEKSYLDACRSALIITEGYIQEWKVSVAEDGGKIVGFCAISTERDGQNYLEHLWIEPGHMGKKIGRRLFETAVHSARELGWEYFKIVADPYAENFYLKMGARRIGQAQSKVLKGFFLPLLQYDLKNIQPYG